RPSYVYDQCCWSASIFSVTLPLASYSRIDFDGTSYAVSWLDESAGYQWTKVSTSGALLAQVGPIMSMAPGGGPSPVAFDGTNHLIVRTAGRFGMFPEITGTRVTPSGTVLDPSGIIFPGTMVMASYIIQDLPDVAFDGRTFIVVWGERLSFRGTR